MAGHRPDRAAPLPEFEMALSVCVVKILVSNSQDLIFNYSYVL